jgi:hypothetical protein
MKKLAILSFALLAFAHGQGKKSPSRYVPDSAAAVQIAEVALVPVYGKKQIESEKPFTAVLKDDVWTVSGTLRCSDGKGGTTTHCVGGTAIVMISRTDGHIISMGHGM